MALCHPSPSGYNHFRNPLTWKLIIQTKNNSNPYYANYNNYRHNKQIKIFTVPPVPPFGCYPFSNPPLAIEFAGTKGIGRLYQCPFVSVGKSGFDFLPISILLRLCHAKPIATSISDHRLNSVKLFFWL